MKRIRAQRLAALDTDSKLQSILERDHVSVPPGVPAGAGRGPPLGGSG
jgi:hypothetical protein